VIAAWVLACRARFTDSSVKTARDGLSDRHPRSPLHLDDSGYLGVLSTPIRTQWKGPPVGRKFVTFELVSRPSLTNRLLWTKIKFGFWNFSYFTHLPSPRSGIHSRKAARSVIHRFRSARRKRS
jgi:hypothetical protein